LADCRREKLACRLSGEPSRRVSLNSRATKLSQELEGATVFSLGVWTNHFYYGNIKI